MSVCGVISLPQLCNSMCSQVVSRAHSSTTYLSARATEGGVAFFFPRQAAGSRNVHRCTPPRAPAHTSLFQSVVLSLEGACDMSF